MTVLEITLIGGLVVSLLSSVIIPFMIDRRKTKQAKAEKEIADKAAEAAGEAVSLKTVNEAIARERDRLTVLLKEAGVEHKDAMLELRNTLAAEAERLKRRTDEDRDLDRRRIEQLATEVTDLHRLLNLSSGDGA